MANKWPLTSQSDRFFSKVDKSAPNGCWLWTAYKYQGYGMMGYYPKAKPSYVGPYGKMVTKRATHISYLIHKGEIPKGMHVLHRCDNPPCVNPDHLYLGTDKENRRDCVERGRAARGFSLPQTKLPDDLVRQIRETYSNGSASQVSIAKEYGISREHVRDIVNGRRRVGI